MKKKLLSFMFAVVACTTISYSQTKVWDFGNDTTTWPLSTGIGTSPIIVDNLGLYPIATNSNFGAVNANSTTFSDSFSAVNRFQMNGGGYSSGPFQPMPTQRYLFVDVSGACVVKVWFKTGSNGAVRTMYVSNGTASVGSESTNTGTNVDLAILTANYTGGAGRLYIYGDTACNLYKLEVTGATVSTTSVTLGAKSFEKELGATVYSDNNQVYVSNITEATTVKVFNVAGQLIKTITASGDTNFNLNQGVYVLFLESVKGKKSVKIAVK